MAIEIDGNITRRYYHTFTADDGTSYRWEIHQDGYDSTVDGTEVLSASTRTHCVTRWGGVSDDEFSPILGSETTISFFEDSSDPVVDALIDNVSSNEEQFAIVIKDAVSAAVRWVGFIDYEDVRRPEDGLVSLSITARDGLGRLEDKYYVSNTSTGALYEGKATLTSIVATLLQQIGWGIDFYIATEIFPKTHGTDEALSAIDNPFDNLYVDRLVFSAKVEGETDVFGRKIPENAPIKSIEVLKAILERFCLRIFQADGAWHIYQVNQYFTTTEAGIPALDTAGERAIKFRRWKYDSSGAAKAIDPAVPESNTEVFTHAVTISNDTVKRSVANASLAKTYSAAQITYNHGAIRLIRQPGFESTIFQPRGYPGYASSDQWITQNETISTPIQVGQDGVKDVGWRVRDIDGVDWTQKTGYASVYSGWANGSGTGAGTIDAEISDDSVYGTPGYKVYQTTKSTIPSGSILRIAVRSFIVNQGNNPNVSGNFNYAVPIQVKLNGSTPKYWTKGQNTDSWGTTPNWVLMENPTAGAGIINLSHDLPELPEAATITFSLGGPFDFSDYSGDDDSQFDDISGIIYDHADLVYVLADGTYNAEASSVINYVDRDVPKIKQIDTRIGDGPLSLNVGSLSLDSAGAKPTSYWAEGSDAAGDTLSPPTDSLNQLQSRIILRGTNEPRNKHQAQYFDAGQILWPFYSIRRSSVNYIAWDIDYDWQADVTAGTWCEVRQFGFTDDLVSGIDSGAGSANWNSSYDRSGFLLSRLSKAFFSDTARRITRTTAYISAGTDATYPQTISVEAIPDALLDVGDYINIVAPDLTFYTVRIAATQLPGDTTLSIDDPDNEGNNFNFPSGVSYPASIFMADDTVMTLARLGEQGFAVTVLGEVIGQLDGNQGPFVSGDSITVKNWAVTMEAGAKVYLAEEEGSASEQRVELEIYGDAALTEPVYKGATTIYTSSSSDGLTFLDNYRFVPAGSVPRSDFQITANEISAYVGNPGDKLGTLASVVWGPDVGSPLTSNTYISINGNTKNIRADDTLLIYTTDGSVVKVTAKDNSSTPTSGFRLSDGDGDLTDVITAGDAVAAGSVIGMRIDSNSIEFTANEVISSNYSAGSSGWGLFNNGSAEFNSVTVRGSVEITGTSSGIANFSDAGPLVDATSLDDVPDGSNFYRWAVSGAPPTAAGTPSSSGLYLGSDVMGYFATGTPGEWLTYMDSSGNFYLGGTSGKLIWDGTDLSIVGDITATGTLSGGTVTIGEGVFGAGKHGISVDTNNYWKLDTTPTDPDPDIVTFAVGDGTNGIVWNGSSLSVVGSISATGTLTGGGIVFGNDAFSAGIHGINIDANNYWKLDTTPTDPDPDVVSFSVGNGTNGMTWNGTALSVTGAINATSGSISGDLTMSSYGGSEWASAKITSAGDIYANDGYFESLTAASGGLSIYSSTLGPASGTLAYANGVFTVDGDDVISEGSIGNGLSYASFTLKADSSYSSGTGAYGGDTGIAQIELGDGTRIWVKCEDVTP